MKCGCWWRPVKQQEGPDEAALWVPTRRGGEGGGCAPALSTTRLFAASAWCEAFTVRSLSSSCSCSNGGSVSRWTSLHGRTGLPALTANPKNDPEYSWPWSTQLWLYLWWQYCADPEKQNKTKNCPYRSVYLVTYLLTDIPISEKDVRCLKTKTPGQQVPYELYDGKWTG